LWIHIATCKGGLIIAGSMFDDWIYWTPLLQLHLIITAHKLNSFVMTFVWEICHCCLNLEESPVSQILDLVLYSEAESELLYDWQFTANQFILASRFLRFMTSNFIFQLSICGYSPYVSSSLMRGWVCHLQLILVLTSVVILRSESRGTHDHILLSQNWDSSNLEGQVPVFLSPRNRVARL
jgi:hypothetical protein